MWFWNTHNFRDVDSNYYTEEAGTTEKSTKDSGSTRLGPRLGPAWEGHTSHSSVKMYECALFLTQTFKKNLTSWHYYCLIAFIEHLQHQTEC